MLICLEFLNVVVGDLGQYIVEGVVEKVFWAGDWLVKEILFLQFDLETSIFGGKLVGGDGDGACDRNEQLLVCAYSLECE
mmetsp:Transcript_28902/g.40003  ORF Transcript_28902/g.40003 Transcript_28902/m.40003 type:complete len:80 (+) Transcript_28902:561-800(+)